MKLAVFSSKPYDRCYLDLCLESKSNSLSDVQIVYHDFSLSPKTVSLVKDADVVCVFVNDTLNKEVLETLYSVGVRAILLRCAGFNNIDLETAFRLGFFVANAPNYSPEAVAEFAVALIQTLNRKTHRAFDRVREGNFALEGLLGKTLHGKTVGVIGTGRIGTAFARIMHGFGCRILAHDPYENPELKGVGEYKSLDDVLAVSDIVSLHFPLTDSTRHIINGDSLAKIKPGAMLVNTSRGGLIDTRAVINALKSRQLGSLALDVYDNEGALFYADHSGEIIDDDLLTRLTTFPNVIICGHQAFFTEEALHEISECTLGNLEDFLAKRTCKNSLVKTSSEPVRAT